MIIHKITHGFVIQAFNTETNKFVSQEFVAGDPVNWETEEGDPIDFREDYLPFFMAQPYADEKQESSQD